MEIKFDYLRENQDKIAGKLEGIDTKLDIIQAQLSEMRGAMKLMKWLAGFIGAVFGAIGGFMSHVKFI